MNLVPQGFKREVCLSCQFSELCESTCGDCPCEEMFYLDEEHLIPLKWEEMSYHKYTEG